MSDDDRTFWNDQTPMAESMARELFRKFREELHEALRVHKEAPTIENAVRLENAKRLFSRASWYYTQ
jgi:hypothetical protein